MVRWDGVGVSHALPSDRTSLVWVLQGSIAVEGEACGPQTAIWSDLGESQDLVGEVGSEVLVIGFPVQREEA